MYKIIYIIDKFNASQAFSFPYFFSSDDFSFLISTNRKEMNRPGVLHAFAASTNFPVTVFQSILPFAFRCEFTRSSRVSISCAVYGLTRSGACFNSSTTGMVIEFDTADSATASVYKMNKWLELNSEYNQKQCIVEP